MDLYLYFRKKYSNDKLPTLIYLLFFQRKLNSKVVKGDIFNEDFAESISRVLGESGILVSQIGDVNIKDKLPVIYSEDLSSTFIHSLLEKDFQLVMQYAGSRQKSLSPWKFVVAMKDKTSRGNWHSSESKVLVEMNKRTLSTKNGDTFRYFDDVTMKSVEFPTRIMEDNFCVDHQDLEYCYKDHGFDPDIPDFSSDSFEVGISSVANGGRGVFSKEFIPKGSYIGMQNCVSTLFIPPNQLSVLNSVKDQFSDNEFLTCLAVGYLEGYGWIESTYVSLTSFYLQQINLPSSYNISFVTGSTFRWS